MKSKTRILIIYFIALSSLMGCSTTTPVKKKPKHVGTIEFVQNEVRFYSTKPAEMTADLGEGKKATFSTKKKGWLQGLKELLGMKLIAGDK